MNGSRPSGHAARDDSSMADADPQLTQADIRAPIVEELSVAGFDDADEVGRGGFGVVYRCYERSLDRTVAVKVLLSDLDEENRERFLREEHAMARMSGHPNIVHVLQAGVTSSGRPYIVMPYHSRDSIDARIRRDGPLEWGEALRIGVKIAGALETAHRLGALHRDVKPANILLTGYGEPQLTDFGIARIAGAFETTGNMIAGSPSFTAPEVLNGEPPTVASDVYSLGATMFCLLAGHPAFERRAGERVVEQFMRITTDPIPDLRTLGIPDDLSAAIECAMAKDTASRPASAAEFGDRLRASQRRHRRHVDEMTLPTDEEAAQSSRGPRDTSVSAGPSASSCVAARPRSHASSPILTPPAPSTKFRPPTSSRPVVERRRLKEILGSEPRRRLTVIHAPAGFGKSTLAAQYRDVLSDAGIEVAWLSVDRDDDNVVWFLAHLIEAIRLVRPTLANALVQVLEQRGDNADRYVLTSLVNEIHDSRDPIAIVIDDWHRVSNAATIAALDFILEQGCHHIQLIVTSRSLSGLPMGRMRVRGELLEIDSTALRFDLSEAREFLIDRCGLPLEQADVANLERTTDGWVAALQLAALSLRDHPDPARMISSMSGRHHALGEYLVENVLQTLEPDLLDFLLSTSIVERICGDLASALAQVERGQGRLEEIVVHDLFLYNIDDDHDWFRYQPLFAQFLRRRLELEHPERVGGLHRTASEWFARHGMLSEAVDHALAAGDEENAIDLVEAQGMDLLERAQMATLLGLVAKLPAAAAETRPKLQIAVAWSNCLLLRAAQMRSALDLVRTSLSLEALSATEAAELRVNADIIEAAVEVMSDRLDGVEDLLAECLSRPLSLRPWVVLAASSIATFVDVYRFDFAAARRREHAARGYDDRPNGPFGVMAVEFYVGIAAHEQLDIAGAEESFRHGLDIARESLGYHSHAARSIGALLGELLYERGDLAEADRLLDEGYELGPTGAVDFLLATYATGARVKAVLGDLETATRRLDEGASLARTLSLTRLAARIDNERIRCGLTVRGSAVESRKPLSTNGNGLTTITAELEEDSAIRLLLAEPSPERLEDAFRRAQALVQRLDGRGRPRALMHARLLLVACLFASGRTEEAARILTPVAAMCAELALPRVLLDAHAQVAAAIAAEAQGRGPE
jgi:serine/threonine-protein kinase PknK